ncbi:MAG: polymer-forming cytoskeletal protein [Gemmatimonadaceae bacterium]|jgi:cytoskeletal protein CcmA (bactofilin family)
MEGKSEIGSSIVIKGQVSAQEDLSISGRVEGSISVEGHALTVNPGAHLAADVEARAIDVQGSVSGVLCASELISLGTSAQVTGEVSAPSLRIVEGAVVQGKCETTGTKRKSSLQLAS